MTTVKIDIPDDQAAALKAKATAQGLTLEAWISRKLADEEEAAETARSPQEAAARIREIQKRTKPDPEGWTVKDYINYGRP
ncbi:MAG: FitA-like ribbon-helix-helix domain-containing protein [Bryobacteraceae bacterium]